MDKLCPALATYTGICRLHLVIDVGWYDEASRLAYWSLLVLYGQVYYINLSLHPAGRRSADCHIQGSIVSPAALW